MWFEDIEHDMDETGYYTRRGRRAKVDVPTGCVNLCPPELKPPTGHYHYSNPNSQYSLISETKKFPSYFNPTEYEYHHAYSDRLSQWDYNHFRQLCELIGTGDQGWSHALRVCGDAKLKEVGKFAFNLNETPNHVRVIHHFNVATGYSCPTLEVLVKRKNNELPNQV